MKNRWDYRYRHDRDTPTCSRKLQSDTSLMTYTGHIVSQTLIRARFSPYESTASRFIYAGDGDGCVYSKCELLMYVGPAMSSSHWNSIVMTRNRTVEKNLSSFFCVFFVFFFKQLEGFFLYGIGVQEKCLHGSRFGFAITPKVAFFGVWLRRA